MKQILTLLLAVTMGFLSSNAQEPERLTISAGQLKNISLGDHMKVVLVSNGTSDGEFKGDIGIFEKLNISVQNGTLLVNPGRKLNNETIYIVVDNLKTLTVGQFTKVSTEGVLYSKEMKVFVQNGSVAQLLTTGEVNAYSTDDYEFTMSKTPVRMNASAKNSLGF
jgi:hypothetical protein